MENERDAPRRLWALPSWLVSRAALQASRLTGERLGQAGVRRKHFSVLATLDEAGPLSQAAIGRRLGLDRSDLHAIVGDLEGDRLVARTRDPEDRRRNVVALTPKGRATLARLDARVQAAQDDLLAPLSAAERKQLVALLTRVVEHHADPGG
ncbi:MAG TPA: MarR family transcriptional regulator [Baekduia sp.]|uniref:MarR family winged helix-turn-helix transcriptional regulator n=1 Tax=Baekduia sp. TaxID=2600305 RepID=UPI002D7A11AD|nr:MarR family transcriptional regulator [Baekduia sp.]HET6509750.1 MarR family transcriptional regulator [Baekduia sp.]